jgi:hypothetical protein
MEHILPIFIPLLAIAGGLSIPVIAILTESRRNRLMFEERRAMIEKGLAPPPLPDTNGRRRKPEGSALLESSLRNGTILLFLGMGLGLGFVLLQFVLDANAIVIPAQVVPLFGVAGCIVALLGIGNLVYFYFARSRFPPAT